LIGLRGHARNPAMPTKYLAMSCLTRELTLLLFICLCDSIPTNLGSVKGSMVGFSGLLGVAFLFPFCSHFFKTSGFKRVTAAGKGLKRLRFAGKCLIR
jgi:hypothetical protein